MSSTTAVVVFNLTHCNPLKQSGAQAIEHMQYKICFHGQTKEINIWKSHSFVFCIIAQKSKLKSRFQKKRVVFAPSSSLSDSLCLLSYVVAGLFLQLIARMALCGWRAFHRELCAELPGDAAEARGVRDPGSDPAVRPDHQAGLVRLPEGRLRVQKCHRRRHALPAGVCERASPVVAAAAVCVPCVVDGPGFVCRTAWSTASSVSPSCPSWPMRLTR